MFRLGEITLTATNAYIAVLWLLAGLLCSLLTDRAGTLLAAAVVFFVAVLPAIIVFSVPGGTSSVVEFFQYGGEVDRYFDEAIIPLFSAIVGALIGELIMPSGFEE